MRKSRHLAEMLYFLAIPFVAGATGVFFRPGPWYAALEKAPGTPPDWVFPVMWNALYLLMGIAALLVARTPHANRAVALRIFHAQLALNALWSPLFFGLQSPVLGLIDILLLINLVALTILVFRRVRPLATVLLLPYLGWIMYAAYLNAGIVALN
jgi:tryptophan-rich sensory protein